ncbi:MAG: cytochrome c3 family protein [Desulfobacteraceae bacterium]
MGEITLESLAEDAKRSEVTFPHAAHFSYNCQQCHHKWNGKAAIQSCTTSGCHDLDKVPMDENGKPVKDKVLQARYYKNAFHAACIGCHKKIKLKTRRWNHPRPPWVKSCPPPVPPAAISAIPKSKRRSTAPPELREVQVPPVSPTGFPDGRSK